MSKTKPNDRAFGYGADYPGLTKREYFAANAAVPDINEWPASTISKIIGYELPLFTTDPTGNLMGFEKAKAILKVIAADALIEELNRQAAPTE